MTEREYLIEQCRYYQGVSQSKGELFKKLADYIQHCVDGSELVHQINTDFGYWKGINKSAKTCAVLAIQQEMQKGEEV